MGQLIVINSPPVTSSFDKWRIYRSTSKTGTFNLIVTNLVTDLTYYDESGGTTNWYKVDFYNSSDGFASELSDPLQGQATNYTTVKKVQSFLQLSSVTDTTSPTVAEIVELINRAEDEVDQRTRHAWRQRYSKTVSGQDQTAKWEHHDLDNRYDPGVGIPVFLEHRKIRSVSDTVTLDSSAGDAFEFWNGSVWEDWLGTKVESRNGDYWIDTETGILYIVAWTYPRRNVSIRIKYRYGEVVVNKVIEDITTKAVAIDILTGMSGRVQMIPDGQSTAMNHETKIRYWREDFERKLQTLKEIGIPNMR